MNQTMNQAWAASIDSLWHSPNLPMWLTIAAACVFAIVLLITLFRADRSVANGALTVITLLAIGIAVTTMMRASGVTGSSASDGKLAAPSSASLPALACLDGLAGESVETACEKALFASADSVAAGVSYTAAQVTHLASFGDAAAADRAMTPELSALRRAIERDRFGLVAQVLATREGCTPTSCPFFQSLTTSSHIASNMTENVYDGFIGRYAPTWGTSPVAASSAPGLPGAPVATATVPGVPPGAVSPPGKPVSGDFPSAASIPPVNIMTPESAPQGAQAGPRPKEEGALPPPRSAPPAAAHPAAKSAAAAARKPAPKPSAQAPVQLAPAPVAPAQRQSEDN